MLAVSCDRRVLTAAGPTRADTLAASVPKGAWARLSAGPGAKGQRYHDWAWVTLLLPGPTGDVDISPTPAPATTAAKKLNSRDNDLRLEY